MCCGGDDICVCRCVGVDFVVDVCEIFFVD